MVPAEAAALVFLPPDRPMTLVRNNPVSLYRQIADSLRADIERRTFEPTGRLPSEAQLVERFGVSRVTVRLALDDLDRDRLIERRKGKGTFVAGKQVRHRIDTLRSFHESLKIQGLDAMMRIIELAAIETPAAFAPQFGRRCTLLERLHLVSEEPVALGRSLLPEDMSATDPALAERRPTYSLLNEAAGREIAGADVSIGAQRVESLIASLVGAAPDQMLLVMERVSYFADGTCAERSEFFIRPERYRFILRSPAS